MSPEESKAALNHPIRVAIASDQAIYLRGLEALILSIPGAQLVGEARSPYEAIQLCSLTGADVLFLDTQNSKEQGRPIAEQIHQIRPATRIILMIPPGQEPEIQPAKTFPIFSFSRSISEDEFKIAFNLICQAERPFANVFGMPHPSGEDDLEANLPRVRSGSKPILPRNQETLTRELTMAGQIQKSILPEQAPSLPGWDIAARLEPARETSGDFYDFIPLTERKWGVVVADVTDKGIGAALFMVLSSTLIRTYTSRFPTLPALALNAVSNRILSDTGGSMFVTALYGILEPFTGRFIFANAGHPPGYLISYQRGRETIEPLRSTGMALGVLEQAQWKQKVVKLSPGDVLILYTDGVIEAENPQGEFFGEERLLDVVLSQSGHTAHEIEEALLEEVHRFVGSAPQQDDIALIIIRRET
ncbi:MAG: SpoIIE family protein phosphatase [Anaerolineaceae bacterium]|nr:SpoIIE family protein phosphatase [Anaerolineaceae bacterium]